MNDEARLRTLYGQMRNSAFVFLPLTPGYIEDYSVALQLGVAVLLEKPMIVMGIGGVKISQRLRDMATEVIEARDMEAAKIKLDAAVDRLVKRLWTIQ